MSKKYSDEQSDLLIEVENLEKELDECKRVEKDLSSWVGRIKSCLSIENLTRAIVVELVDRIEVSEVFSVNGEKNLDISVRYRFEPPVFEEHKNKAC